MDVNQMLNEIKERKDIVYKAFKKEFDKLSIGNKKRALKVLYSLNNNTYDPRRGCDGVMLESDIMANEFIAFKYVTWLSQFYPTDEKANFMLECSIYLANTPEGAEEGRELYSHKYQLWSREAICDVIIDVEEEISKNEKLEQQAEPLSTGGNL